VAGGDDRHPLREDVEACARRRDGTRRDGRFAARATTAAAGRSPRSADLLLFWAWRVLLALTSPQRRGRWRAGTWSWRPRACCSPNAP
jgi:hypothetical protein